DFTESMRRNRKNRLDGFHDGLGLSQVTIIPKAAADMATTVIQPRTLTIGPLTRFPNTERLFAISMSKTNNGGASSPLSTEHQNRAWIGLMPMKLMNNPAKVEAAMMR